MQNRTAMLLTFIHHANLGEIEMANLAKQNSSSAQVKDFADQIIKDHKSAEQKVMAFADSHNIDLATFSQQLRAAREKEEERAAQSAADEREARAVGSAAGEWAWMSEPGTGGSGPSDVIAKQQSERENLKSLKGPEFDREFAKAMVNDHQAIIGRLTTARGRVSDANAVAQLDQALATAKQHLTMAQKLQDTVSKSS
jgi:predicted outer membrane protein